MRNEQASVSGKATSLMILLHGLGSNGDDLMSLVPFLRRKMPSTHFYAPDGLEACDMGSFGYQWFSLQDRSEEILRKEMERAAPLMRKTIEAKAKELNLGLEEVILLGFSQGTMASLYLALSSEVNFKAVIGFSGALIRPIERVNSKTPICLIHGEEDSVVSAAQTRLSEKYLRGLNMEVESLFIPYLDHSIDMKGIEKAVEFILKH